MYVHVHVYSQSQSQCLSVSLSVSQCLSVSSFIDEFTFKSDFSLRPDQIIVAADQNIGYVCMDADDL